MVNPIGAWVAKFLNVCSETLTASNEFFRVTIIDGRSPPFFSDVGPAFGAEVPSAIPETAPPISFIQFEISRKDLDNWPTSSGRSTSKEGVKSPVFANTATACVIFERGVAILRSVA